MGSVSGLNYQSVDFVFRTFGVKNRRKVLADLQIIEYSAVNTFKEKTRRALK